MRVRIARVHRLRNVITSTCLAWLIAGSGLLLSCLVWTLLSSRFQYGEGHYQRPIIEFLGFFLLAWMFFILGSALLFKTRTTKQVLLWILIVSAAVRAVLVPSSLILENDVYRYVLDGQILLHGMNPYGHVPLAAAELADERLRAQLERPEARATLSRIGYPEIPTIYPPMGQLAFAVGAWLGGWDWMGQRWTFMAVDVAVIILLLYILRTLALPGSWVLLYAWNPLVLKEVINSAHLDVLVVFFVLLTAGSLAKQDEKGSLLWALFSGMAVGLAILSKLYPVLLVPACSFFLWRRTGNWATVSGFVFAVVATSVGGFLPFLEVEFNLLVEGLSVYLSAWTMNEGAFALISQVFPYPRLLSAALILMSSFLLPWFRQPHDVPSMVETFQWVLLLWFLLIPAPFPWYVLPLLVLLPLRPQFSAVSVATLLLSVVVAAYYLSFFYDYHDYPYFWWQMTRIIEHGTVWLALALLVGSSVLLRREQFVSTSKGE